MYKSTSNFFRDMNVRGPDDFGPKGKNKHKRPKVHKIRRILEERTSRNGTVWVTAEVYKKKKPVYGRLFKPDDREWMIELPKLDPPEKRNVPTRTGRKVRIQPNPGEQEGDKR